MGNLFIPFRAESESKVRRARRLSGLNARHIGVFESRVAAHSVGLYAHEAFGLRIPQDAGMQIRHRALPRDPLSLTLSLLSPSTVIIRHITRHGIIHAFPIACEDRAVSVRPVSL